MWLLQLPSPLTLHDPRLLTSEFPYLNCFYFLVPIANSAIISGRKKGHTHIPTGGWAEGKLTSSAEVLNMVSVNLSEKKYHIFICNNLWLKSSTHSIIRVDIKSRSSSSTCFSTSRNHKHLHKALKLLQKSQTVSCLSPLQRNY